MHPESLTPHEVLRFGSVIAVGMTLLLTASTSYFFERHHRRRPMFALTLMLIAWCTVTLGTAISGVGRMFPLVLVLAPFLSGYAGPALFIYTRQLTTPQRPASLKWLWLGVFGTTYSILSLILPGGLDYATQSIVQGKPYWHEILSPFMLAQAIQLVTFTLLSTALITHTYWTGSRPDLRRTQFWLLVTCWSSLCILVLTSVLPNFKIILTQVEPALMTLPIAVVGCLSVRALGQELQSQHAGQAEIRAHRMDSLGRMARGLAHDLNNVLAAVIGHAELAKMKLPRDAPAELHLRQIIEGSQRAAALMNRMMTYSGRVDREHDPIAPKEPIEAAFYSVQPLQEASCRMTIELDDELPMTCIDPIELSSAIGNLLSNAIQALPQGRGRITLRAFAEPLAEIPSDAVGAPISGVPALRIEVEDSGRGMTEAQASRALEPFYSSRPDGKGLGLVGVLSTVKGAGGALWFRSERDVGTRFVIWLPTSTAEPRREPELRTKRPDRALVIDDDAEITQVLALLLESMDIQAQCFESGERTLNFLRSPQCPEFQLAIVDIRLRAMDGIELSHRLLHHHGVSGILLISGDEPGPRLAQFSDLPVVFRRKPLSLSGLHEALDELRLVREPAAEVSVR